MAHIQKVPSSVPAGDLLNMLAMRGLEQHGRPQAAKNSPVDCFLVRGRVPMPAYAVECDQGAHPGWGPFEYGP